MAEHDTGVRIEHIDADDFPAFRHAFGATFGHEPRDEDLERSLRTVEVERGLAARAADGQIVGTSGAYTYEISLPGGRSAPCGGVTVVSVRADHRRRGLLTRMMTQLLEDSTERGEPFSALWASESPIYGRYGYGPAVPTYDVKVERVHGRLRHDGPVAEVRLVSRDEALEHFPELHERSRRQRGGLMARSSAWWDRILDDPEHRRDGAGPRQHALLPGRGFATYRLKNSWTDDAPDGTVQVDDLVATDADALAALWRFVLDVDLAARVTVSYRPVDDPVLALLGDPQRARVRRAMALYLRLVDVEAAVTARSFAVDGSVVLELTDVFRPSNSGRWRLTVASGQGQLEHTDDEVDLHLDIEALATVFLGGVRTTQLRLAGQVRGDHAAAVRLDRLLATDLAPASDLMF
jgi:predicted acetyltransferase